MRTISLCLSPSCTTSLGLIDLFYLQEKNFWTAGLGAINSVRSPGGEIHYEFPFQMKETQLEIQVTEILGIILCLILHQPGHNCTWLHGKEVIRPGPDVICAMPVEDPCQTHKGER